MSAPSALIVEDEPDLARLVAFHLRGAGFEVEVAHTGEDALAGARVRQPDVVLLDLALPDVDGYEVCRRLRADARTSKVGILMMTAAGLSEDRIEGFEAGADDFVVKPFNVRELVLRARAVARRAGDEAPAALLVAGPVTLDPAARRVLVDGVEVELRRLELLVLEMLMTNPTRAFSRRDLLAKVWQVRSGANARIVDVTVSRLRDRLGAGGEIIETVPGLGYRLRLKGRADTSTS